MMPKATAFEKRVKRHVTARSHPYFCATPPGLESLCRQELQTTPLGLTDMVSQIGGVEGTGRLTDIYRANLHVRTSNRILMRIDRFKASNFKQLDRSVSSLPWELFIKPGPQPRISVSAQHSRLFHKKAVAERVLAGIESRWHRAADHPSPAAATAIRQSIFIRIVDDHFLVSLDSSGDLLYRRGVKVHRADAPLRETLAAALLMLAGYRVDQPLIDPMCGSGTFCLEAAMMAARIPAGWYRDFAFFHWPAFSPAAWNHIRKKQTEQIRLSERKPIFASDLDETACRLLAETIESLGWQQLVEVRRQDFLAASAVDLRGDPGLVVINPPFGRRLAKSGRSRRLFDSICAKLSSDYRGWKVGLVVPRQEWLAGIPFQTRSLPVRHGGLRVFLVVGRVP